MGTKNTPGKFDCYENALLDEPMFILLARDPSAPAIVKWWADAREAAIDRGERPESDRAMVEEASTYFHVNAKDTDDLALGYMRELDAIIRANPPNIAGITHPAAPVSADAVPASADGVKLDLLDWLETEIMAIDHVYRGSPSHDHDAYWMKSQVYDLINKARANLSTAPVAGADAGLGVSREAIASLLDLTVKELEYCREHGHAPDATTIRRLKGAALSQPLNSASGAQREASDSDADCMRMLNALRRDEGHAVTLICDNPDFNGQPNCVVEVCGEWTDWHDKRFGGDTLHQALKAAHDALTAATAAQ